jgi:hypothetical protein
MGSIFIFESDHVKLIMLAKSTAGINTRVIRTTLALDKITSTAENEGWMQGMSENASCDFCVYLRFCSRENLPFFAFFFFLRLNATSEILT